ncbi:transport and Golgi organization protein 2 homolog isoform X1 [Dermacentor variabilis]|uniref:transport and Golgi organization protein 2 homolog isoform X1 n=2 Tax=Dermacentor variabilis TaxID=34621 RepID=UPI003F5BD79B
MCLLYLFVNPHPKPDEYLLVLASVRDEFFGRPTSGVHIWENNPQIVGPMDLEEGKVGGTWLGMNTSGKVASLLNIIQPLDEITGDEKLPRGHLAVRYLEGAQDGMSYLRDLRRKASDYNRFLLVTLDVSPSRQDIQACCYTNALDSPPVHLKPGFHAFGNSNPLRPWRKVVESRAQFGDIVQRQGKVGRKQALLDELIAMMSNSTEYFPDDQLLKDAEGRSEESLRSLSSVFVRVEDEYYGSRTHSVILVDSRGCVDYTERTMQQPIDLNGNEPWVTTRLQFGIQEPGSLVSRL